MKGSPAIYLGRIVNKEHFRAVVYGTDGSKKLVKSWAEFELAMQSGLWFATAKDAKESVSPVIEEEESQDEVEAKPAKKGKSKPKSKPKGTTRAKVEEVEEVEEVPQDDLDDGMVYEVKDNEF